MARPKRIETEAERKARMAGYVQRWRVNNPDKQKLARQRAYQNRKLKALTVVGNATCIRCGCDEIDFLEFNHKNGDGCKDWRDANGIPMMDRILTGNRNTDDLEILCRVCNALDHLERKNGSSAKKYRIYYG